MLGGNRMERDINRGLERLLEITGRMLETSDALKRDWGHIIKIDDSRIRASYETFSSLDAKELRHTLISKLGSLQSTDIIEPKVEIIESYGCYTVLIIADGVHKQDIRIKVEGNVIFFEAECEDIHYYKELSFYRMEQINHMEWSCNEGMVKIIIDK